MLRFSHLLLMLALCGSAGAQDPQEAEEGGEPQQAAAQTQGREPLQSDEQQDVEDEARAEELEATIEPAERFDPTEEVDEDYSIAFPVDI